MMSMITIQEWRANKYSVHVQHYVNAYHDVMHVWHGVHNMHIEPGVISIIISSRSSTHLLKMSLSIMGVVSPLELAAIL